MKNEAVTKYIGALVDELITGGVRDVIISPGTRNTPISLLFMEREEVNKYLNIDERSASYFGLGISKLKQQAPVIVSTSGTATTNFYSAVASANIMRTPLIILTADRPPYLRGVGAPQTIDQVNLYGSHAKMSVDLDLPTTDDEKISTLRKIVYNAVKVANQEKGVVHLNIPIDEPLVPDLEKVNFTTGRNQELENIEENESIDLKNLQQLIAHKKILAICGMDDSMDYSHELIQLSDNYNIPLIADPLSNMRQCNHHLTIDTYDAFLRFIDKKFEKKLQPDYIVQIGAYPVSKQLYQFIKNLDIKHIVIDGFDNLRNPVDNTILHIKGKPRNVLQEILNSIEHDNDSFFTNTWVNINNKTKRNLNKVLHIDSLFEGKVIKNIQDKFTRGNIFIANSLPIRYFDHFYEKKHTHTKLMCNRGANGIDGIVSTALGVACTSHEKTLLVIGDLSFYHDLTGLLISKTHDIDLIIVLFNNEGGGIFEFLPQAREKHYEYIFELSHGIDFKSIIRGFGHNHVYINSYEDFDKEMTKSMNSKGLNVLEIKIDKKESKRIHDELIKG